MTSQNTHPYAAKGAWPTPPTDGQPKGDQCSRPAPQAIVTDCLPPLHHPTLPTGASEWHAPRGLWHTLGMLALGTPPPVTRQRNHLPPSSQDNIN